MFYKMESELLLKKKKMIKVIGSNNLKLPEIWIVGMTNGYNHVSKYVKAV